MRCIYWAAVDGESAQDEARTAMIVTKTLWREAWLMAGQCALDEAGEAMLWRRVETFEHDRTCGVLSACSKREHAEI
jgi:hypothetical protein